jgi:hypothetical protein
MARDGLDLERPDPGQRSAQTADHFATHFLRRLPTPKWQTRQENLPTLANPSELDRQWRLKFGSGGGGREMDTHAFEAAPNARTRYIGVTIPKGVRPTAWLIYFRHTPQEKDFSGNLLELGIGDYLVGRMQVVKQVALSGKNVGVVLPIANFRAQTEFASNQAYVTQCLREIETSLFGSSITPSLLAASNSDGLFLLRDFLRSCPALLPRLKAIYDFDGSHHVASGGITLAVKGVRTFRYDGRLSPTPETWPAHETEDVFLRRTMGQNPTRVPLALSRWREHNRFKEVRPNDDPNVRPKKGNPDNEAHTTKDFNWLHHHIPSCMLQHGLASTAGV